MCDSQKNSQSQKRKSVDESISSAPTKICQNENNRTPNDETKQEIVLQQNLQTKKETEHLVELMCDDSKYAKLLELLRIWHEKGNIAIYVDRMERADKLKLALDKTDYAALVVHGGMKQQERTDAVAEFRRGTNKILISTSIAGRGLDFGHVMMLINYDPSFMEDYFHRSRKSGTYGTVETVCTFMTLDDQKLASYLVEVLQSSGSPIPPELQKLSDAFMEKNESVVPEGFR